MKESLYFLGCKLLVGSKTIIAGMLNNSSFRRAVLSSCHCTPELIVKVNPPSDAIGFSWVLQGWTKQL